MLLCGNRQAATRKAGSSPWTGKSLYLFLTGGKKFCFPRRGSTLRGKLGGFPGYLSSEGDCRGRTGLIPKEKKDDPPHQKRRQTVGALIPCNLGPKTPANGGKKGEGGDVATPHSDQGTFFDGSQLRGEITSISSQALTNLPLKKKRRGEPPEGEKKRSDDNEARGGNYVARVH